MYSGELCSLSFRVEYLHNSFGVFLRGRVVSSLIYFFFFVIYITIDAWMLFSTVGYNPIQPSFVTSIVLTLAVGKYFHYSFVPGIYPYYFN